jgi:hypothetical protein
MTMLRIRPRLTAVALAIAVATASGCQGVEPPPDPNAPPTVDEKRALGIDAYEPYFLNAWRRCTRFRSDDVCRRQIYGGDEVH